MAMDIFCMKELERQGLVTTYYSGKTFWLCRVADWSLMAVYNNPSTETDEEGDVVKATYYAFHVDKTFAEKLIANNDLFLATMLSNVTTRVIDLEICSENCVEVLCAIRDEVRSGARECLIDEECEDMLKGAYNKTVEPWIAEYGNPPVFTEKKYWLIMLSFLLYPLGLPWFLSGNKKMGFIELGVVLGGSILGILFMPIVFVALGFAVVNVFYFFFKLVFGQVKDEKGRRIITRSMQTKISNEIERYNTYKKELSEGN